MADDERSTTDEEARTTTAEDVAATTDDQVTRPEDDERLSTADLVPEKDVAEDPGGESAEREPLFAGDDAERFRSRWQEVQVAFVDEPQQAVKDADSLVAELMQRLAETFSQERTNLESQWDSGDDASTEDLRVALQRYRSFFDRLLSA
ncbi:hypothetical protein BH20ACT13_BH20ACT13_06630 [soil metagenome]